MSGEKEDRLKILQAWLDVKFKIAGFALIANGAALGTAVAFLKDKGPEQEGIFTLHASEMGLTFGAIAVAIPLLFSDTYFANEFDGVIKIETPQGQLPAWALRLKAVLTPMRLANTAFLIFIFLSAMCLTGSVAYLSGVMDARRDFFDTHPGARERLERK